MKACQIIDLQSMNMKEARLGEVDITDVDPDTLKKMLEFIYTEQVVNRIP